MPEAPCQECVENKGDWFDDDQVYACYCQHNRAGGVYKSRWNAWDTMSPFCKEDFEELALAVREKIRGVRQFLAEQEAAALKNQKKWN